MYARKNVAGSMFGGIAETETVIDHCQARNLPADLVLVRPEEINRAYDPGGKVDGRYHFVTDVAVLGPRAGLKRCPKALR